MADQKLDFMGVSAISVPVYDGTTGQLMGLPDVTVGGDTSASQTLSCFEMWVDGTKAIKHSFDPVSDVVSSIAGFLCCVAVAVAQAEDNNKPATRGDVIHANQIRHNDEAERGCAYETGAVVGDVVIDSASIVLGSCIAGPRALGLFATGNNQRSNTVFGFSRKTIDQVDLASSCRPLLDCFSGT